MSDRELVRKGFRPELDAGEVTIEQRDIEMLEAIDRTGSLHNAAHALERSYARLQRRVVELEEAVGRLTNRRRGGKGGGGTDLTSNARDLCRRFERHVAELEGLAAVPETIFAGRVTSRSGELATVATDVGTVTGIVPPGAEQVEITVRADAVVLSDPAGVEHSPETSLRNQFTGDVREIVRREATALIVIELQGGQSLRAIVTRESLDRLSLGVGQRVAAGFKATAARATPHQQEETN